MCTLLASSEGESTGCLLTLTDRKDQYSALEGVLSHTGAPPAATLTHQEAGVEGAIKLLLHHLAKFDLTSVGSRVLTRHESLVQLRGHQ